MNRILFLAIPMALALACPAFSQSSSTLSGRITDPSGAPVAGARVRATNADTSARRETTTAESGTYTIPLLSVGTYAVEAEARGFKIARRAGIILQIATSQELDFKLDIGDVSEVVNVDATAPLLETESHSTGAVIENRKIVELPLNSRTFYGLAYLVPGVIPPAQNSTLGYRGGFNVAGSSESSNNFTINGIDNNNDSINAPAFRPSVDSIEEFKVQTGTYGAEYGRASGGQVVVTTKSGTNALHASGFEFLRNQVLDARNFFTPPNFTPAFKRNQYGATAGGPIARNRTFFFFSYEGLNLRQEIAALATVPTTDMISGDFRALLNLPAPIRVLNPTNGQAFATPNVIPASQINPVGRALAALYPKPSTPASSGGVPSANYNFDQIRTEKLTQYSLRLDHAIGSSDSVSGTINFFDDPTFEPSNTTCGARVLPGFGCNANITAWLAGITETHTFTPTLLNEVRLGFNRYRQTRLPPDGTTDFIGQNGIQGVYSVSTPDFFGVPATTVRGYSTLGLNGNLPQDLVTNKYQIIDNLVWIRGTHTIKFGFDVRRSQGNNLSAQNGRSAFVFNATATTLTSGYSMADLLLGYATSSSRNQFAPKIYQRTSAFNGFAQDDWKILPTLTLNLGIRYELNTPFTVLRNQLSNFDLVTGKVYVAGQNGGPSNVYQYDRNNIQPRIGLAWKPSRNLVVRAGFGFYGNSATTYNGVGSIYFNPPFRNPQTFNATTTTPVTLSNPFPVSLAAGSTTLTAIAQDFADAYVQQWSAGVQRSISTTMLLDVNYVGSKGTRLPNSRGINQPAPGAGTTAQVNARRPYPNFGNISWFESNANSNFHSLQARFEKRYSAGLSMLSSYTWAKSIDNAPGFASNSSASLAMPQNARYMAGERGRSDFDVRHRIVVSTVYELPFGPGKRIDVGGPVGILVRGWQLSGIFSAQSGNPVTPYLTANISNTFGGTDRPNVVGDPNSGPKTVSQWFTRAAFVAPAAGTFGNAGRNIIGGPGLQNLDLSLSRTFKIRERLSMQFRGEVFNSLNHSNFALPLATVDGAGYGQITSAQDPRQIQFGVKISF